MKVYNGMGFVGGIANGDGATFLRRTVMAIKKRTYVLFCMMANVGAAGLWGCGDSVQAPGQGDEKTVQGKSQAIWRGHDDADDGWSNAVVRLTDNVSFTCSGTLISSRLVLTANHCLYGSTMGDDQPAGTYPLSTIVQIGNDRFSPHLVVGTQAVWSYLNKQPTTDADVERDVALLMTDRPIVEEAYALKPHFVDVRVPIDEITALNPESYLYQWGFGTEVPVAYAGWGTTTAGPHPQMRQIQVYEDPRLGLWRVSAHSGYTKWHAEWEGDYYGPDHGDSGGPLFYLPQPIATHPGAREVIGVMCSMDAEDGGGDANWSDITSAPIRDWINSVAADPWRPGRWYGEADYSGPCDSEGIDHGGHKDKDCDRWFDEPGYDNCPTQYNPEQLPVLNPLNDFDGDGVVEPCDNCRRIPNYDQTDSDHDGTGDPCDPCDNNQPDLDGDGEADACEKQCPCDPVAQSHDGDGVCDACDATLGGFCAAYCTGGPVVLDNCPNLWNPAQTNCNSEAESSVAAAALGDECDPVPCPAFKEGESQVVSETYQPMTVGGAPALATTRVLSVNQINVTPLPSMPAPAVPSGVGAFASTAPTHYRYCVNISGVADCGALRSVNQELLMLSGSRADEDESSVWHRITMTGIASPNSIANPWESLTYAPGGQSFQRHWQWEDDFAFWASSASQWNDALPCTLPLTPGACNGRLWVSAVTSLGTTAPQTTGLHGRADNPSVPAAPKLANHYEPWSPLKTETSVSVSTIPRLESNWFVTRYCPNCIVNTGDSCTVCGALAELPGQAVVQPQLLTNLSELGQSVLRTDGSFVSAEASMSTSLKTSLKAGTIWADAVEPSPLIGRGSRMPMAVALSSNGTLMADKMYLAGRKLVGPTDLASGSTPAASSPWTPKPRSGFAAVYSRAEGALFLVGGEDSTTKTWTGDLWQLDVATGSWLPIDTRDYSPEKVLAATYSFADRHVWILDEIKTSTGLKARLARVDRSTGYAEIAGSWPRNYAYDSLWLVVDQKGAVLLEASDQKRSVHTTIRMSISGRHAVLDGFSTESLPLAGPPVVDPAGYTFVTKTSKGLKVTRSSKLTGTGAQWTDFAKCL